MWTVHPWNLDQVNVRRPDKVKANIPFLNLPIIASKPVANSQAKSPGDQATMPAPLLGVAATSPGTWNQKAALQMTWEAPLRLFLLLDVTTPISATCPYLRQSDRCRTGLHHMPYILDVRGLQSRHPCAISIISHKGFCQTFVNWCTSNDSSSRSCRTFMSAGFTLVEPVIRIDPVYRQPANV